MTKAELYLQTAKEIAAVLDGETNNVARMATVSCLLSEAFESYFWTGFYVVDPMKTEELVVGPYQGTLGCLRIPFSRGVCGAAAKTGDVQIVEDVHAFPGHIACDARSRSEIVVPVYAPDGSLFAVFDVDSTEVGSFDQVDAEGLAPILKDVIV
ncbi:MAG: GAF domain-containing protein [Litorimonas sp.]